MLFATNNNYTSILSIDQKNRLCLKIAHYRWRRCKLFLTRAFRKYIILIETKNKNPSSNLYYLIFNISRLIAPVILFFGIKQFFINFVNKNVYILYLIGYKYISVCKTVILANTTMSKLKQVIVHIRCFNNYVFSI